MLKKGVNMSIEKVWLQKVEQVAKEEILPFATMEKITKAAEKHKLDARSLMELIKVLWANDLVGYYEIKKILKKKKAEIARIKAEKKQCKLIRGIYFAFVTLTEPEYFILVRERQNLLEDPMHSKQMNKLKQKILYLYNFLNSESNTNLSFSETLKKLFSDQDLMKQITSINPDNFFFLCYITSENTGDIRKNTENIKKKIDEFLNFLVTRYQRLTQEINAIENLPQKIETRLKITKQTCASIKEKIDELGLVLEDTEKVLKEWKKDKKILKELNKNKKDIKKAFKTLSSSFHNLEMLSFKLYDLIGIQIVNEKKNELRKTKTKIQQLKEISDNFLASIEKQKEENQTL